MGGLIYSRQFRNVIIRRDASVSGFRSRCSATQAVYHLKKNCHMTNPPTPTPCTYILIYCISILKSVLQCMLLIKLSRKKTSHDQSSHNRLLLINIKGTNKRRIVIYWPAHLHFIKEALTICVNLF